MSAPTNSTFWNQTTPAVPSGDQAAVIQSDGATPQDSRTIYPKTATSSLRGVVKPDGTTTSVDGFGNLTAKTMVGSGTGHAAGIVPDPGATAGTTKFLREDATFAVPPAPTSTIPATIRGHHSQTYSASSVNVAFPAGSQAGDLAIVHVGNGWAVTLPTGWTDLYTNVQVGFGAPRWSATNCSKVLTSGDISTGYVTVSMGGSSYGVAECVTFVGAPTIRESPGNNTVSNAPTNTIATSSAVLSTDTGVFLGSGSADTTAITMSAGTIIESPVQGVMAWEVMPAGVSSITFTFGSLYWGTQCCVVIVEGIPSAVGSVTSVGMTVPSWASVSGSPVTDAGTFALTMPPFVASGTGHAPGIVPDPGATAGTTKFLREDATFAVPPGTGGAVSSLTTIGSSGAATLSGGVLNIPTPSGGGGGGSGLFSGIMSAVPTQAGTGFTTAWAQGGSFTITDTGIGISMQDVNRSGLFPEGAVKAYPGTPFTATGLFSIPSYIASGTGNSLGFVVMTSLTGNLIRFGARWSNPWTFNVEKLNSPTSFNGSLVATNFTTDYPFFWLRYKDDGTNITIYISSDGIFFQSIYTVSRASSFLGSSGFVYFGIWMDAETAVLGTTLMSYTQTSP